MRRVPTGVYEHQPIGADQVKAYTPGQRAQKKDKNIRLVPVEAFHQISAFIGRYAAVEPHVLVPATPPKSAQESPAQIHRKNHEPGQAEIDIHGHTFIMYDDIIKYNVFAYTFGM
jgi:hypothetical protein